MVRYELFKGIAAGLFIGIGCIIYLSCENPIIGALLFSIGLYAILTSNASLYTGKIGFALNKPPKYTAYMIPVWIGNFLGAGLVGLVVSFTKIGPNIMQKARTLVDNKLADDPVSILILSVFCGILMYVAAFSYDKFENNPSAMQLAGIVLPVTVFILCGFEHCVANMCYFVLAQEFTLRGLIYILLMTLGNTIGGIFIPMLIIMSGQLTHDHTIYKRVDLSKDDYKEQLDTIVEEITKIKEEEEKQKEDE